MAPSGPSTTVAPTYRAWTAAKRFIVADSGPGTHTRASRSIPVSRETCGKESTQERGRPDDGPGRTRGARRPERDQLAALVRVEDGGHRIRGRVDAASGGPGHCRVAA